MGRLVAAVLACLLASAASAGEDESPPARAALPGVLTKHGFGHPTRPVRVVLVAPIGCADARPTHAGRGTLLPHNSLWVFRDPAPVWAALAKARTRRFDKGRFPGADARILIDASHGDLRRRIHLHDRAGEGDISLRRGTGRFRGGGWSFAPAADAALVALLSRTPPTALGASPRKVFQLYRPKAHRRQHPRLWVIEDTVAFRDVQVAYRHRYATSGSWTLPKDFDWKTHVLVGVELPAGTPRKVLDWSGARVRRGVLAWELGTTVDDRAGVPAESASTLIGVFRRSAGLVHVRADFRNGTQVEVRPRAADDYHVAQPDAFFLRVTERRHEPPRGWTDVGTIEVRWAGSYVARRGGRTLHGEIPMALCLRLRTALRATITGIDTLRSPPPPVAYTLHVDDTKTRHPDGIQDLLEYLAVAHGD